MSETTEGLPSWSRQYQEQAAFIALTAQALADGRIPEGQVWATVAKLADAMATLKAWTRDDRA